MLQRPTNMARRKQSNGRPTMETVAELAGVSKITVSRALRGSDLVRPELRERIAQVASEAGYRMNVAARSLRTQRTQMIAVVIDRLGHDELPVADPLVLSMIGGLLQVLTAADHAMLLTTSNHFLASSSIGADGVIMIGQGEAGSHQSSVAALGFPMVAWGEPIPGQSIQMVSSDNREGGRLAARHVLEIGCRRALFFGDDRHPEVATRLEGVREVFSSNSGLLVGAHQCGFSIEGGVDAANQALQSGADFDAVIAANDLIAAGACDAFVARGRKVPDDLAIIGFDNNIVADTHKPSITTVRQDFAAAGRALAETIFAVLDNADAAVPSHVRLPVELIRRESTRRPVQ